MYMYTIMYYIYTYILGCSVSQQLRALIREKRKPNQMATGHGCQRISVTNVSTSPLLAIVVLQGAESLLVRELDPKFRHHRSTISIPTDWWKLGNVKDDVSTCVFSWFNGIWIFDPAVMLCNSELCRSWQGQHAEGMEETERRIATLRASRALGSCGNTVLWSALGWLTWLHSNTLVITHHLWN